MTSKLPLFFDEILQKTMSEQLFYRDEDNALNLCEALKRVGIYCSPVVRIWENQYLDGGMGGKQGAQVAIRFEDHDVILGGVLGWDAMLDGLAEKNAYKNSDHQECVVWSGDAQIYTHPHSQEYVGQLVDVILEVVAKHTKGVLLEHVGDDVNNDNNPGMRRKI